MERDTADALARANEENRWRQEELQRQQERELEEQKRQLEEHQEHLRREAEIARCEGDLTQSQLPCSHRLAPREQSCNEERLRRALSTCRTLDRNR